MKIILIKLKIIKLYLNISRILILFKVKWEKILNKLLPICQDIKLLAETQFFINIYFILNFINCYFIIFLSLSDYGYINNFYLFKKNKKFITNT